MTSPSDCWCLGLDGGTGGTGLAVSGVLSDGVTTGMAGLVFTAVSGGGGIARCLMSLLSVWFRRGCLVLDGKAGT